MRYPRYVNLAAVILAACMANDGSAPETTMSGGDDAPVGGPDSPVRYQTKYVDVAPSFSQSVCRGTLDELDRHVELLEQLLEIEAPARIRWDWVNEHAEGSLDSEDRCEWCNDCNACYRGDDDIYGGLDSVLHEITHAMVIPSWGRSDVLFNEGIAEGLEGTHVVMPYWPSYRPTDYASEFPAPHFVRWLLERDGPAKLRELFAPRLGGSSTKEEVFAAVEEVYGVSFEDLEAEYFATAAAVYPAPGLCDGLVHIPWNGDRWELRTTADCDAPHVFGPFDVDAYEPPEAPAPMAVVVTLDIPPALEGIFLTGWSPSGEGARVVPCFDEPLYDVDPEVAGSHGLHPATSTTLPPGRYRLTLPVYEPGDVYARVCPHNGARPQLDPTVDPEHCIGD
jgi:hypothetical protein